jgi:general secretion pathway protein N
MASAAALGAAEAIAQTAANLPLAAADLGQAPASPDAPQRPLLPREQARPEAPPRSNPLWEIPLASLAATRERPLFSRARRPAALSAPAPPSLAPAAEPIPEAVAEEAPPFTLLGTVIDADQSLAIFLSQASNSVIRRHIGEAESGWVLESIDDRTTKLAKNARQITLALPARGGEPAQSAPPAPVFTPPGFPAPPAIPPAPPDPFDASARRPHGRPRP